MSKDGEVDQFPKEKPYIIVRGDWWSGKIRLSGSTSGNRNQSPVKPD